LDNFYKDSCEIKILYGGAGRGYGGGGRICPINDLQQINLSFFFLRGGKMSRFFFSLPLLGTNVKPYLLTFIITT